MPLRPELYRNLKSIFIHVQIANEGCEMHAKVFRSARTGKKRLSVSSPGEYYRVNCPFCSDTRKRLWINHRWGILDPETESLNLHLAICFNEDCLQLPERRRALYSEVFSEVGSGQDILLPGTKPATQAGAYVSPGQCVRLDQLSKLIPEHSALNYLRRRQFDPIQLGQKLEVSYCMTADSRVSLAQGRLIIPVMQQGQRLGWQARLVDAAWNQSQPKYYSMPGMKKTQLLYNLDMARQHRMVVLCEGVTDVWRLGPASVAIFGKTLSDMQRGQKALPHDSDGPWNLDEELQGKLWPFQSDEGKPSRSGRIHIWIPVEFTSFIDQEKNSLAELTTRSIETALKNFRTEFKKELRRLTQEYGRGNVTVKWGIHHLAHW